MSELIRAWLLKPVLDALHQLLRTITMNQAELAADLATVNAAVQKIGTETAGLLTAVDALQAALDAAGTTTPEVDAALAAVKASVAAVDALVPDAAP